MEIVTYVLEGRLGAWDSLGNGATILPGDVQRMSAGKGILHSEFNHDLVQAHAFDCRSDLAHRDPVASPATSKTL